MVELSEGMTTTANSGYQQVSPFYTIAKNSQVGSRSLADRLGLNHSARGRTSARSDPGGDADLLA